MNEWILTWIVPSGYEVIVIYRLNSTSGQVTVTHSLICSNDSPRILSFGGNSSILNHFLEGRLHQEYPIDTTDISILAAKFFGRLATPFIVLTLTLSHTL